MNLDDLKQAWQNQITLSKKMSEADLLNIFNKPSASPVAKMKRNLKSELIFILISFSAMSVYYFIFFGWKHVAVPIVYISFVVLFLVYYQYKSKLLNKMLCVGCHVKSNITLQVNTLEKLVKNYLVVGTIICTAAIIFIFKIEYYLTEATFLNNSLLVYSKGLSVILFILCWAFIIISLNQLIYWANKWYLNKLYGQHIAQLKELLEQLEEE